MGSVAVAGVFGGWALVFLGLVAFFALVWWRRREQSEFLLFAAFASTALVHAVGATLLHATASSARWAWGWRVGTDLIVASAILSAPLIVHFAARVARVGGSWLLRVSYALAGLYLLVLSAGWWWAEGPSERGWQTWYGLELPVVVARPSGYALSFYALAVLVLLTAVGLLGRAVLRGERDLRPAFAAALGLCATTAHDLYWNAIGAAPGLSLTPLGYLLLSFGVSLTLVRRYGRLGEELEASGRTLERRSEELRRSYEALQLAQGELVRREQLAVVGELAAVIAHEVRNPLAVITNAVAGLKRDEIGGEDRTVLLGIINEESARLNRLVGDLLSYARPVSPQRQSVLVGEFVERSVRLQLGRAPGIQARFAAPDQTLQVSLDPGLIRQVIDNVVGNAVQAMRSDGQLEVRVRPHISEGVEGVMIEVQDDGEGMDTQVRTQAMTPFFTTRPSGTGLGLAIVDRIVEAHGGAMSLDSRPGQGTTVSLFLPRT